MYFNKLIGKIKWSSVWFVAQLILLLFVAALGNWFIKSLDPAYILSPEWWGDTLTQVIYNYAMLYLFFKRRINKLFESHVEFKDHSKMLQKEIASLDPNWFNPWLDLFNVNQKTKHFIDFISKKLEKLENKVKPKDIYTWEHGTELEKSKNKYCKKRHNLESKIVEEYLKNNIRLVDVGYREIQKSFITNGYHKRGNSSSVYEVESGLTKFIADLIPKTIILTGLVLILRTIVLTYNDSQDVLMLIFQTLMTLVPMVLHANTGWEYGAQYFEEKIMVDARIREEIIALYYQETKKVGETNGNTSN